MTNIWYFIKFQLHLIHNFNINIFYSIRFWITVIFNRYNTNYYSSKNKKGWELTFEDDFDSDEIDWGVWSKWWSDGNGTDRTKTSAISSLDCLELDGDTHLIIKTEKNNDPSSIYPLKSGRLFSSYSEKFGVHGFQQMFGYFETRCKPPKQGILFWPAFWLWNNTWPPEIDVFEFMSEKDIGKDYTKGISFTTHWGYLGKEHYNGFFGSQLGKTLRRTLLFLTTPKWNEKFHVYACKWTPYSIKWYIDDLCVYRHIYNIPTTQMSILLSSSPGVEHIPTDDDLPGEFIIDYVRVYKKTE